MIAAMNLLVDSNVQRTVFVKFFFNNHPTLPGFLPLPMNSKLLVPHARSAAPFARPVLHLDFTPLARFFKAILYPDVVTLTGSQAAR